VEWSLEHRDSLLSIFAGGMSSDRPEYLIDILGVVGNAKTVELLRNYVDDPAPQPIRHWGDQAVTGKPDRGSM